LQELNELDEEADLPLEELLARWVKELAGLECFVAGRPTSSGASTCTIH
jgi:hypothetical protein